MESLKEYFSEKIEVTNNNKDRINTKDLFNSFCEEKSIENINQRKFKYIPTNTTEFNMFPKETSRVFPKGSSKVTSELIQPTYFKTRKECCEFYENIENEITKVEIKDQLKIASIIFFTGAIYAKYYLRRGLLICES